ncbi:MAG: NAD-dependent epimerase/dehydratase family protein [Erysipelotrichaceae bacterium]|nr:NAD-dependent epimerase/dehydratase family protein [Erysipelotrichaceae bacterium]
MEILVIGGTRFFGIPMIAKLLEKGHHIAVATRGNLKNPFSDRTENIILDRTDTESVRKAVGGRYFDVIIDKVAYSSNDVRALLENVRCGKYIQMSTGSVYTECHEGIMESEFEPQTYELKWQGRTDDYTESKRQAERAAYEYMTEQDCVFVRYPIVLGIHDYTNRLRFYVEHVMRGQPMYVDDADYGMSFIHEKEAGEFMAHLVSADVSGAFNGCSYGFISPGEIIRYIESKTGKKAVLSGDGDPAPFNGLVSNESFDTGKALSAGYRFSNLRDWIFDLTDILIEEERAENKA